MREDLSRMIQRRQETEDRLGVRIEALYAYRDGTWIHVNGEIHALGSGFIEKSLNIVINLYDAAGRLLGSMSEYVDNDDFDGFDSFSSLANLDNDHEAVTRILVYAKSV
jgi:hypothetical protein